MWEYGNINDHVHTHTKPMPTVINSMGSILKKKIDARFRRFDRGQHLPKLGMNATFRLVRPVDKSSWSSISSHSSSRSPAVDWVSPFRVIDRVVISNSLLRPQAGCWKRQWVPGYSNHNTKKNATTNFCKPVHQPVRCQQQRQKYLCSSIRTNHRDNLLDWSAPLRKMLVK